MTVPPFESRRDEALRMVEDAARLGEPRLLNAAVHVARENGATERDITVAQGTTAPERRP